MKGVCDSNFSVYFFLISAGNDGKEANLTDNDTERRNTIAHLLSDWGLIAIINKTISEKRAPLSQIKVLSFKEKGEWDLQAKYNIGKKVEDEGTEV